MKIFVGVTDGDWYHQLSSGQYDEVNFWNPGGTPFKALQPNDMFLFKLHAPYNYIVGGGFFVNYTLLPPFLAWQAFGEKNGTKSYKCICGFPCCVLCVMGYVLAKKTPCC